MARLARLRVDDDELLALSRELGSVLGYMARLTGGPAEDPAEPAEGADVIQGGMRPDIVTPSLSRGEILREAPARDADGHFLAPGMRRGSDR